MITEEYDYTDQEVYEMTCECPAYYIYNGGGQTLYCQNIWNLAVQNQATDRAHRIGQENIVTVYKLIAKGTIEENIVKLQEKKMALADQIIGGEEMGSGSFSKEELLKELQI